MAEHDAPIGRMMKPTAKPPRSKERQFQRRARHPLLFHTPTWPFRQMPLPVAHSEKRYFVPTAYASLSCLSHLAGKM